MKLKRIVFLVDYTMTQNWVGKKAQYMLKSIVKVEKSTSGDGTEIKYIVFCTGGSKKKGMTSKYHAEGVF